MMFSSRHPRQLQPSVRALWPGGQAGSVREAIAFGDAVLLAVPYATLPDLGREHGAPHAGKNVRDACHPISASAMDFAADRRLFARALAISELRSKLAVAP